MSRETEKDRNDRIREAQLHERARGSRNPQQNGAAKRNQPLQSMPAPQPKKSSQSVSAVPFDLLNLPLGAKRDIVIGLSYGLIPALMVIILLPGALKLGALLILGIAAFVGYMIGAPTS